MKSRRMPSGKKHVLLFYKDTMQRVGRLSILLDMVLWLVWWFVSPQMTAAMSDFAWYSAAATLGIAIFAFFAKNMGYAQAKKDYLLLATPFLRLKISYSRIASSHPMEFVQLFSPRKMRWADKRFARPYFSKTVVAIVLNDYPISKLIIRLFFPKYIFHPQEKAGFVLVVKNWMALSTEIDSYKTSFGDLKGRRPRNAGMRGLYGSND